MDLATFDLAQNAEEGTTLHLRNPITGKPLEIDGKPVTISVKGADGETYQDAQRAARLALLPFSAPVLREVSKDYQDAVQEQASNVLAAVTTGWSGIRVDGEAWGFNADAAGALYDRFPWIKEQVDEAVNDRRRFYKGDPADLQHLDRA